MLIHSLLNIIEIQINNGEKWGITFDEWCRNEFILSDGTFQLIFWDASMLDAACESLLSMQQDN